MITKTLRIKKIYFDAIADGSKTTEYRACKAYYAWLKDAPTPFLLRLHYQRGPQLVVMVERVRRMRRKNWMDPAIIPTRTVWSPPVGSSTAPR